MVQDDLDNQEAVVRALNHNLAEMRAGDKGSKHSPLLDKQEEMNELWKSVNSSLRDKRNRLQEKLTGVSVHISCAGVVHLLLLTIMQH